MYILTEYTDTHINIHRRIQTAITSAHKCTHACMCAHVHIDIPKHTHMYTHTRNTTHAYIISQNSIHQYPYKLTYTHMHVHMYTHTHKCTRIHRLVVPHQRSVGLKWK